MSDTRLKLRRKTSDTVAQPGLDIRRVDAADSEELGRLMHAAYLGTVDYAGESIEDAIAEIRRTFGGGCGTIIPEATLGLFADGRMQSAVIVTLFENEPMYAFCITGTHAKRRGYCRALMMASLAALQRAGFETAHLYVTASNEPAVRLYRRIGFETVA